MKYTKKLLAGLLAISVIPTAQAGIVGTYLEGGPLLSANITVGGVSDLFNFSNMGTATDLGGGTTNFTGNTNNTSWNFGWDISANADPFITGNLNFINTTSNDQTFNVVLVLPTDLISGAVNETGTLGLRLTDTNVDGSANLSFNQWHGLINPVPAPPILDMPLLLGSSFDCGGVGCSTLLSPVSNNQTHSEINHNGQAITSIGTHLNFTLSAGDSVSINTRWDVAPVPVPAAVWLFMSGLAGLVGFSKLKKQNT